MLYREVRRKVPSPPVESVRDAVPSPLPLPKAPSRVRRWLLIALVLWTAAIAVSLVPPAAFRAHLHALEAVSRAPSHFDRTAALVWQSADIVATAELAEQWPFSLFRALGENIALALYRLSLLASIEANELGYRLFDVGITGQLHLIEAAQNARWSVIFGRGSPERSAQAFAHYWGHPLETNTWAVPVSAADVHEILGALDIDDRVFQNLDIFLLPYVLRDVAGLGARGRIVLGAAPGFRAASKERTVYALLHELGHHIHFRYLGPYFPLLPSRWDEYMELREIAIWTSSGRAGSDAWRTSTEETFAEDFRVLFTPPRYPVAPHATAYGDPRKMEDGGAALRKFIESLW